MRNRKLYFAPKLAQKSIIGKANGYIIVKKDKKKNKKKMVCV